MSEQIGNAGATHVLNRRGPWPQDQKEETLSVRQIDTYEKKHNHAHKDPLQRSLYNGLCDHDSSEIIGGTYALKHREGAISLHRFPAHFGSKKAQVGQSDGLGF
jgi:hypothetical protein